MVDVGPPPLRRLNCPLVGCFGDNEGNRLGIRSGMSIVGQLAEPPFGFHASDGTRILVTHQWELFRGETDGSDVVIFSHTHRAAIQDDGEGRLLINPGETGGWTYGRPSVAILETRPLQAKLVSLLDDKSSNGKGDACVGQRTSPKSGAATQP